MLLAVATRERAACLGRHVGAVLVSDQRIIATGYNGTPTGFPNCDEGGCHRCANPADYLPGPRLRRLHLRPRRAERDPPGRQARLLGAGRAPLLDAASVLRLPQGGLPGRREPRAVPERLVAVRPGRGRGVRGAPGRGGAARPRGRAARAARRRCSTCARRLGGAAEAAQAAVLVPVERERVGGRDDGVREDRIGLAHRERRRPSRRPESASAG